MEMLRLESGDGSIQYLIGSPIRAGATVLLWELEKAGARALQLLATIKLNGKSCFVLYDEAAVYRQDKLGRVQLGLAKYYKLQIEGDWQEKLDSSADYFADEVGNVYLRSGDDRAPECCRYLWLMPNLLLKAIHQESGILQMFRANSGSRF